MQGVRVTPTLCSRKKASSRLAGMRWETSPRFTTTARPSRWPSPKHTPRQPGAIPNYAGQLLSFVHEMQVGDLVLYPSKRDAWSTLDASQVDTYTILTLYHTIQIGDPYSGSRLSDELNSPRARYMNSDQQ